MPVTEKALFVHIPKAGGTSIEQLLGMTTPAHFFSRSPIPGLFPDCKTPQHFTLRELKPHFSPQWWNSALKFSWVRNPWDRLVSEYCWRRNMFLKWPRARRARCFYSMDHFDSLDTFVDTLEFPKSVRDDAAQGFDGHLETQLSFVLNDSGRVELDFIGRYERFDEDARMVLQLLGLAQRDIPHAKKSDRERDYRVYYTPYSRDAVKYFYASDIAEFGYRF